MVGELNAEKNFHETPHTQGSRLPEVLSSKDIVVGDVGQIGKEDQ